MSEYFLQYIWKHNLLDKTSSRTINGDTIEIIATGNQNLNSGPDFLDARIKINNTLWVGNVEIHKSSSDWRKHQHNKDKAYNNVILHVVEHHDEISLNEKGCKIPIFILKYPMQIKANYKQLLENERWVACEGLVQAIDIFSKEYWLNKLTIERLEEKANFIMNKLEQSKYNWEEVFYVLIARNFGFKVNAEPFERLARALPLRCLAKHKNNLFQIEALLFGQAGFLEQDCSDKYFLSLQKEYLFLQKKFGLKPIEKHNWKFMRLRPVNFPTIRIAQFAQLIHKSSNLFSQLLEQNSVKGLAKYFDVEALAYWNIHYKFGVESAEKSKKLGKYSINTIIINTVIPLLFVYGKHKGDYKMQDKALALLESIPAENNAIIKNWNKTGISSQNASYSQALLQLKNKYCDKKKCLDCLLGNKIIRN